MKTVIQQQNWFARWFNSPHYHQLYRSRDDQEAGQFIDLLLGKLKPAADSVMLDLGCGSGRHSRHLASKGFTVFGLDLASSSIRRARKHSSESLYFLNWDMRRPFGKNNFDYVFNFFTSFGYFQKPGENEQVVKNIARALKPGGTLMIDYLNSSWAEDHLVPLEEKEIDGTWYHINRWADQRFIYKHISIRHSNSFQPLSYTEQVAKFDLEDFTEFFGANGVALTEVYGDYQLSPFHPRSSKRIIMIAKKQGAR